MTLRIIAGLFKGRLLKTPKGPTTRPTQGMLREAVFNICQNKIENARFLDLYAGSGAMAFEALSRGAKLATLVESNRFAISCIRSNIALLKVENQTTLIPLDAEIALGRLALPFDIIYIDPPYGKPVAELLEKILSRSLMVPGSTLFVEERYNPKKKVNPFESKDLVLIDSRRFGTALLHQYQFREA